MPPASTIPQHLMTTGEVAEYTRLSTVTILRYHAGGLIPLPRVGGSHGKRHLWAREDIEAWVDMGMPPRAEYDARREADLARSRRR